MKYCNLELPVCNRQNALFRYFLNGISNLAPIQDFIDISLNFNGDITESEKKMCIDFLHNLNFDVYYKSNIYNFKDGMHSILKIREDTHSVSKNKYPIILSLDDDIEITSKEYCKDVLAAIYMMLKYPDIGVISLKNYYKKIHPYNVTPANMKCRIFTSGGLFLKDIPEWNGLVPDDKKDLFGYCADVLLGYERIKAGYKIYAIQSTSYEHESHRKTDYLRGYYYHKWNKSIGKLGSINYYLEKIENVKHSSEVPDSIWTKEKYWDDKNGIFDYSQYSIDELKALITELN